jgi:hypothetical protein
VHYFRFRAVWGTQFAKPGWTPLRKTRRVELDKQELERDDWQQAENTCEAAIELARSVGARLGKGAAAHSLLALLRQELQLASRLRSEIHKIDPSQAEFATCRDRLAHKLRELATLEDLNRKLLSRRGVLLNGPGMYRQTQG